MVVGTGTAQVHQFRLQDPLLEGNGGEGAQGGGGQIDRQKVLHQITQAIPQLQAVALPLLTHLQGGVAVGVVGHQGD